MREYKTGEAANFFGVSKDTIRLYDTLGIISPRKEEVTGYRYYSRNDMICLAYVMHLRRMNLPLEQIRILLNDTSIQKAEKLMEEQEKSIDAKIQQLLVLRNIVHDYRVSFRETINMQGKIEVRESPVMIYKDITDGMTDAMSAFLDLSEDSMPKYTFVGKKELFLTNAPINPAETILKLVNAVTFVDKYEIHKRHDFPKDTFKIIKPRKCIYSVIKCYVNEDYEEFFKVLQTVSEKGLSIIDDILMRVVSLRNGKNKNIDYYEVWIPVA